MIISPTMNYLPKNSYDQATPSLYHSEFQGLGSDWEGKGERVVC